MDIHAETVVVDLAVVRSSAELLDVLAEVFEFGGPDGNIPVSSDVERKGWGQNWDALQDCLCYLDTGGIWGTSNKRRFPLLIRFTNSADFRADRDGGCSMLIEILETVKERYLPDRLDYSFE
jgi:hypothetical protein